MTTWGSRSSGSPTTSVSGTTDGGGPDVVDERAGDPGVLGPRRRRLLPGLGSSQRERHPGEDVGATVLDVCARVGPLPPHPFAHDEDAERRAAPRAGIADEDVPVRRHVVASQRGHRVDDEGYAAGAGRVPGLGEGLAGADLAVGALQDGHDAARHGQGRMPGVEVEPARPVDAHLRRAGTGRRRPPRGPGPARGPRSAPPRRRRCAPHGGGRHTPPRRRPGPARSGRWAGSSPRPGRTPRPAATTSRERSSSARARRPSAWRAAGSAQPTSTAARRVSRATGCRGPAAASSRRRGPAGRGRRDGSNVRARIVTDHSATLAAPCGHRDKWDGRVAPWAFAAQTV